MNEQGSIGTSVAHILNLATQSFCARFNRNPTLAAVAPGRVNLIGEHTDYNAGYALPIAIDRWAIAVADIKTPDESRVTTIASLDLDEEIKIDQSQPLMPSDIDWANYPLGVLHEFRQHGIELPDLNLMLTSSVPIGAGLSSSAAITVSIATIFEQIAGIDLEPEAKAAWCQRAEHEFPNVPCGIMDPTIAVKAMEDHALLLDCQSYETKLVPLPPAEDMVVLIANTNKRHSLSQSEYSKRRDECAKTLKALTQLTGETCQSLRNISLTTLHKYKDDLDPVLYQRSAHVVQENMRVLLAVQALLHQDLQKFGQLIFESHESLRDTYEVSCPELDTLVELAGEFSLTHSGRDAGVYGARMTGAGFGGCTITLCKPEAVEKVTQHMIHGYRAKYDTAPTIFEVVAADGAQPLLTL